MTDLENLVKAELNEARKSNNFYTYNLLTKVVRVMIESRQRIKELESAIKKHGKANESWTICNHDKALLKVIESKD